MAKRYLGGVDTCSSSATCESVVVSSVPDDDDFVQPPASKRPFLACSEPVTFSRVRSLEELEKRTLQLQNSKLCEALTEKRSVICDLRQRIEQLENRQAKDDALLCVVNRYWNQLDEDCLLLLQRCESDIDEEVSASAESFLKQLASWDREEVPEKLQERVHFSKRIVARLLTTFERLAARHNHLRSLLVDSMRSEKPASCENSVENIARNIVGNSSPHIDKKVDDICALSTLKEEVSSLSAENQRLQSLCTSMQAKHRENSLRLLELQDRCQTRSDAADEWQAKYDDLEYKYANSTSQLARLDHRLFETQRTKKLLEEELATLKGTGSPAENEDTFSVQSSAVGASGAVTKSKYNDILCELEEQRELATNRLSELECLQRKHEIIVAECAKINVQLSDPPESLIKESPPYKSLKVQFNLLFNEVKVLRGSLEESRTMAQTIRHSHLKQIEEMEANETAILNQMRAEMLAQEDLYSQLRREFETIEADYKQTASHNEQAGPINSEMRSLISTLQLQNKQLKTEIVRYRRKCKESAQDSEILSSELRATEEELSRVRSSLSEATAAVIHLTDKLTSTNLLYTKLGSFPSVAITTGGSTTPSTPPSFSTSYRQSTVFELGMKSRRLSEDSDPSKTATRHETLDNSSCKLPDKKYFGGDFALSKNKRAHRPTPPPPPPSFDGSSMKMEPGSRDQRGSTPACTPESIIKDLRAQLKASQESQKEMSVLLNMYKVIPKDQRDKACLLQAESKLRSELNETRAELSQLQGDFFELQHQYLQLQKRFTSIQSSVSTSLANDVSSSTSTLLPTPSKKEEICPNNPSAISSTDSASNVTSASSSCVSSCSVTSGPLPGYAIASSSAVTMSTSLTQLVNKSLPASPAVKCVIATSSPMATASPTSSSSVDNATAASAPSTTQNLEVEKRSWQVNELQLELQHTQRKCNSLIEQVSILQHRLVTAKQQEDVLLKEMEVTGQAFEDVQEQNVRLVKTLREKDDANLNQMAEWMKTSQLVRLLKEDKKLLDEQARLMHAKIEALNRAIQKQEDKERLLLTNLSTLEKEAVARQHSQEAYKRKAVESEQASEDLRVTVQKYLGQLNEAQIMVQEKASAFEQVSFRHQRLQEELVILRRKYERLRKIEQSHNADEVLLAEIQDYKEQLTCPTCKTNKKDAILTKCFHVFCLNCLKTRYDTRHRKCPKCNATFGANDYHRIYLT